MKKQTNERTFWDLQAALKDVIMNEFEKLPELLNELTPKERADVLTRLTPYVLPRVESINASARKSVLDDVMF